MKKFRKPLMPGRRKTPATADTPTDTTLTEEPSSSSGEAAKESSNPSAKTPTRKHTKHSTRLVSRSKRPKSTAARPKSTFTRQKSERGSINESSAQQQDNQRAARVFLIGISGAPVSGKTTLAYLLESIMPPYTISFIIHQDDYTISTALLIPNRKGVVDADCHHATNFHAFKKLLKYTKRTGHLPPTFKTSHDEAAEKQHAMTAATNFDVERHQDLITQQVKFIEGDAIGIVEGSLLYQDLEIADMLDVRFFLRTDFETALSRRLKQPADDSELAEVAELSEKRKRYFRTVVWQNHIKRNGYLFHQNNVEGIAKLKTCSDEKLHMQCKEFNGLVGVTVSWAIDILLEVLGPLVRDANWSKSGSEPWTAKLRRLVTFI